MNGVLGRVVLGCALLVGACRGCASDEVPAPERTQVPAEAARKARIQKRFAQLKINLKTEYPRDAKGRYACGEKLECFVVAAHRCEPAVVVHRQTVSGYGIIQRVRARYQVLGELSPDGETCGLTRHRLDYGVTLDERMPDALAKQGKSPEQIEQFRLDAETLLGSRNPYKLRCELDRLGALEVALDLLEGKYKPAHWRGACRPPKPGEDMGADADAGSE